MAARGEEDQAKDEGGTIGEVGPDVIPDDATPTTIHHNDLRGGNRHSRAIYMTL